MPGPLPKHSSTRQRRNATSTRAILHPVSNPDIPDLPEYVAWHPAVVAWWRDAWASPMVPEWTESDRHVLDMAARSMQTVWAEASSPGQRTMASAEVRMLLRECGLTPMARRALQWEVDRGEEAEQRTRVRRNTAVARAVPDPRAEYPTAG
ncbi:MAG TPA: hypothetical protein VK537_05220 [Galbitalea sp.]|nr:hypothetical protein [Galbitalea sp.]